MSVYNNTGSEANDLALRMAREHTKHTAKNPNDVIVLDWGYHGNTTATMELSPYKWGQKASANTTIHCSSNSSRGETDATATASAAARQPDSGGEKQQGRKRQPAHVHVVSMPDVYRGAYSRAKGFTPLQAAALYAAEVAAIVTEDSEDGDGDGDDDATGGSRDSRRSADGRAGRGIGGCGTFIAESAMGCGGQVGLCTLSPSLSLSLPLSLI